MAKDATMLFEHAINGEPQRDRLDIDEATQLYAGFLARETDQEEAEEEAYDWLWDAFAAAFWGEEGETVVKWTDDTGEHTLTPNEYKQA